MTDDEIETLWQRARVKQAPTGCTATCCTGRCDQGRACVAQYPRPMPRIVPCSTLARWWLAVRRFWLG